MNQTNFKTYQRTEWDRKRHYKIDDKREYPSSTTILSVKDKPALPTWAAKFTAQYASDKNSEILSKYIGDNKRKKVRDVKGMLGLLKNDITGEEYIKDCKGAPWRMSGEAMNIGSTAHAIISEFHDEELKLREHDDEFGSEEAKRWFDSMIELEKKEKKLNSEFVRKLKNCIGSFLEWREDVHFVIVASEFTVYSDTNKYAGTIDALGYINGVLTLIDYKTSSGIWPEHDLQTVSYLDALNEMYQRNQIKIDGIVENIQIINFNKEGTLEKKNVQNHKEALDLFLCYKNAFVANQIWDSATKMTMAKNNQ